MIVQSWMPDDLSIRCATRQDVKLFYNNELSDRSQLNYPPFSRMIAFSYQGQSRDNVMEASEQAVAQLRQTKGLDVLGPAPAMIEKSHLGYHWKVVLKSSKESDPKGALLRQAASHVLSKPLNRGVRISVDVDPYQVL